MLRLYDPKGKAGKSLPEPQGEPPPRVFYGLRQDRVDIYAERFEHGFTLWTRLDTFRRELFAADLCKSSDRLMNGSDDEHERIVVPQGRQLLIDRDTYDEIGNDEAADWLYPNDATRPAACEKVGVA